MLISARSGRRPEPRGVPLLRPTEPVVGHVPARALARIGLRTLARHPWQTALMIVGIMLGVAVMVAIDLANSAAGRAFDLSTDAIAGRATHQIVGGPAGVAEAVYTRLRVAGSVQLAAPIVAAYVTSPQLGDRPIQLLGVDPFAEGPFRSYLEAGASAGNAGSAAGFGAEVAPQADASAGQLVAFLTQPGALLISEDLAREHGLAPGDEIRLDVAGRPATARLVGLLRAADSLTRRALDGLILADIATAQELTGQVGRLDHIDLILTEGEPFDCAAKTPLLRSGCFQELQSLLPSDVQIVPVAARAGALSQMTAAFRINLTALSLLALVVAIPLGALGARGLTQILADMINFDVHGFRVPPDVLALEAAIGLAVPLLASLYPIISAARITPHEAMSDFGLSSARATRRPSRFALRGRVTAPFQLGRVIGRPTLLSLRNTFRRKGRLALTLATLILGGGIFIGVFSVRDSVLTTLDAMFNYVDYDAVLVFRRPYRIDQIEREARSVPGVVAAEGWRFDNARRMRPDDTESDPLFIRALPAQSALVRPRVVEGRWLLPEDENAVVINTMLLKNEPDIKVGDPLKLKIAGKETEWRVVGLVADTPPAPMLHVNYTYAARLMGEVDRAGVVIVVTEPRDAASQAQITKALEAHFKSIGMETNYRQTSTEERAQIVARFDVLIIFLLIMAVLLAVVGAIGLAGTMSLNVLERTREIGVMRAIGASDGSVFQIVVIEGILIGLISWASGALLAFPFGKLLSDAIGNITMKTAMNYTYSTTGLGLWLATATILAILASLLPARNASRVSVRDVLAYE